MHLSDYMSNLPCRFGLRVVALVWVWSLFPAGVYAQQAAPVVKTRQGKVSGVREGGLEVFRGIPYAQPPVGALRFRPPQPLRRHSGTLAAVQFGSRAPQAGGPNGVQGSEDCLYLNVWAPPRSTPKQRRPVVVWVHGGAFTGGSGQDNDTWTFAAQDTLVAVSINYRLGSLGFLELGNRLGPKYAQAGNSGLLDAVAALRWVHQNIAAFGGDPNRVTIMGESAGAKLVGALLVTPAAQGLFQQVILESGAVQAVRDTATAGAVARQLLQALHLPNAQALLTLPADSLVRAQARFTNGAGGLQVFGPVLDGRTIPLPPQEYLRQSRKPLRVLLGTNLEEAYLFSGPGSVIHQPNETALDQVFGPKNSPYVWQAYQQLRKTQPEQEAWNTVLTDYLYRLATYRLAQQLAERGTPTWLYRFDYRDSLTRPMHAQELAFVWNAPKGSSAAAVTAAPTTAPRKASNPALAAQMHAYWAHFIKTGQPGPAWPAYTPTQRQVMVFKNAAGQAEAEQNTYQDPAFPMQGYSR
ncbi:carboxylesterase family protein [Hymenobacter taeanensis]|uniref:Carboxylic ester hydrolase n=1 Tax=Hymenobacter taeanensis TaxID=2735321 RepID=A0A6M6BJ20_9BACT|nr:MULTISPECIES: carboxylesterase family protein [Hymenobacter]QJX48040.1 carboxylesterase family protein [Hymenobacter taeanensis]UOQ82511.1 carboxylesterase family protein [Hymenobacter sp. 5414T-23]